LLVELDLLIFKVKKLDDPLEIGTIENLWP